MHREHLLNCRYRTTKLEELALQRYNVAIPSRLLISRNKPLMVPTANINRLASLNAIVSSPTGHRHRRSCIRWQLHFQVEAIPVCSNGIFVRLKVPANADFTISADVLRIRRRDVAAGNGCDVDTLPAWLCGREATDVCVDPIAD